MFENENDILGFDPTQLDVLNQNDAPKSAGNPLIYKTRPADSISEDHVYRATIKVVYNPFNLRQSVLEQQSYGMQDKDGWFTAVSTLTNGDTSCPIFKAWKKCHFADPKKDAASKALWLQAAKEEEGGKALFDKRFARYVVVQVLEDKNQPEQVGKFLFWKMPKSIWDIIQNKMAPSAESKKPKIPVMDFLFGRSIDIEVTPGPKDPAHPEREQRETKYTGELSDEVVTCINPDGSPLLNDAEQAILDTYVESMMKIWKTKDPDERATMEAAVNADPNTVELRKLYVKVLEQIKGFCPNLIEELGYKPWTPELTARVNNWIKIVLECKDPATYDPELEKLGNTAGEDNKKEEAKADQTTVTSTAKVETTASFEPAESTDDLPF